MSRSANIKEALRNINNSLPGVVCQLSPPMNILLKTGKKRFELEAPFFCMGQITIAATHSSVSVFWVLL